MTSIAFTLSSLSIGGIQRVTALIANTLAQQGYDVTLLNASHTKDFYEANVHHYKKPPYLPYKRQEITNKLRHKIFRKSFINYRVQWVKWLFTGNQYDMIILNPEFFVYFDVIKKLHPESKIVLWMHNNYDIYIDLYFKDNLPPIMHAAKSADGIICLEQYSAAHWRNINKNTVVLHNPLTMQSTQQHCNLNAHSIAFVARLVQDHKGLDYLLETATTLPPDWSIEIAGSGPDQQWLEEQIHQRHLEHAITLHGSLHDNELDELYRSSSIFLMTSRWEGFPLVAVEAMSRGLPIVGFDIPALQEVTDHGQYGLLSPLGDIDKLSGNVHKLMLSIQEREHYSSLSIQRAQAFSLETIIQDWKDLIRQLSTRD